MIDRRFALAEFMRRGLREAKDLGGELQVAIAQTVLQNVRRLAEVEVCP